MNKIAAYEKALNMLETEKLAEEIIAEYGIDGQLPPGYLEVLMAMQKEGGLGFLGSARNLIGGAGVSLGKAGRSMARTAAKASKAGDTSALNYAKGLVGSGMQQVGTGIAKNPLTAAAGGTAALGAASLGAYKMMKPNEPAR